MSILARILLLDLSNGGQDGRQEDLTWEGEQGIWTFWNHFEIVKKGVGKETVILAAASGEHNDY